MERNQSVSDRQENHQGHQATIQGVEIGANQKRKSKKFGVFSVQEGNLEFEPKNQGRRQGKSVKLSVIYHLSTYEHFVINNLFKIQTTCV